MMKLENETKRIMAEVINGAIAKFGPPPIGKGSNNRHGGNTEITRFGRNAAGRYYVTRCWRTMEAYDDDHESRTGRLLNGPCVQVTVEAESVDALLAKLA